MKKILFAFASILLRLRYRIIVKGINRIRPDDRPILFLPNHQALIDPVIIMSILYPRFAPRPLASEQQFTHPLLRPLIRFLNMVVIPDMNLTGIRGKNRVSQGIEDVISGLRAGDNILMYPSGRLCRSRTELIAGNSGVAAILSSVPDVRVVLVRIRGLWGSSFSRVWGVPDFMGNLVRQIPRVLANLIVLMPKRTVTIEFVEPDDLPLLNDQESEMPYQRDKDKKGTNIPILADKTYRSDSKKMLLNRYLEEFYNHDSDKNTYVPYFWWEGRGAVYLPEPKQPQTDVDTSEISLSIRSIVMDRLREMSGMENIVESDSLSSDLGMDSLMLVEFGVWLQEEFGVSAENLEDLRTVGDCIMAAAGIIPSRGETSLKTASAKWFRRNAEENLSVSAGDTIAELFIRQARKNPDQVILSDQVSGDRTWRQIITAIYLLVPEIKKLPGQRVGIMLPASVVAAISYLSVMFSGKEPVMVNWTSGELNIRHGLDITGVDRVITSSALLTRLKKQGIEIDLAGREICIEDLTYGISRLARIFALIRSRLSWHMLERAEVAENAVILFTSGSEARPKAVPLTHKNFLSNIKDVAAVLSLSSRDSLAGILPVFHSLGLAGTVILPLCMGLKTVYWPNPTEGIQIARMIRNYRCSILLTTPSFLDNIMRYAQPEWLDSLRLVFSGAEACPKAVYRTFSRVCPHAILCEGYGVTECSPVISMNSPDDPKPGSIGRVLPSMEYMIVDPDTGGRVQAGLSGRLLVRGPNVFKGYLGDVDSPFVKAEGKMWYDTGDLVFEDNGVLFFAGRLKRFVKIGGEMISLPAIEQALAEYFPVGDKPVFAVMATQNEKRPELVLITSLDIKREDANKAIKLSGLSPLHNIIRVKKVEDIKLLATGKIDYVSLESMI